MLRRDRQVRNISIKNIVPNMITSGSVFCGVSSLIMSYHGHLVPSAVLICFAVFFDVMDGRVARSLGGSSTFGEELDSLADAISFGVAPAFLMYVAYAGIQAGILGALASFFFVLCGVLRLARFNVTHATEGPFQGLPIPAAGVTLASFVLAKLEVSPFFAMTSMIFVGGLMVSSVPYWNAKKLKKDNVNKFKLYSLIGFIIMCFVLLREKAFLLVSLMYIGMGLAKMDCAEWLLNDEATASEKK